MSCLSPALSSAAFWKQKRFAGSARGVSYTVCDNAVRQKPSQTADLVCTYVGRPCSRTEKYARMTVLNHVVYLRSGPRPVLLLLMQKQRLAVVSNSNFPDRERKKVGMSCQQAQ